MKHLLSISFLCLLAISVYAQQPQVSANTKVTYSTASNPKVSSSKIHITPEDMVLTPGKDNNVHFAVDGVSPNQIIVKVVSENLCKGRKGEQFGDYILTPTASEGEVVVRVGSMDFMGAFVCHGDVTLYIGSKAEPASKEVEPTSVEEEAAPAPTAAPATRIHTEEIIETVVPE